jgi:hypothetical protein
MMDSANGNFRALILLLRLHARGFFRRLVRNARSPRGIILTVVGGFFVLLWLGGPLLSMAFARRQESDPTMLVTFMPLGMLVMCVISLFSSAGGKAIQFTVAETDQLFPAPFTRAQILLYRFARTMLPAVFGALFMNLGLARFGMNFFTTYLACVLTLAFIVAFTTTASLAGQALSERFSGRRQRVILGGVLAAALVVAAITMPVPLPRAGATPEETRQAVQQSLEHLQRLHASPVVQVLESPFRPFVLTLTARSASSFGLNFALCAGIIGAIVAVAVRLDADFLETSAGKARQVAERLDKARKHGIVSSPVKTRFRPPLPGHSGPGLANLWRQATTALRNFRSALLIMFICCAAFGPILIFRGTGDVTGPLIGLSVMLTFVSATIFRFDFRGDLERLEVLKAMPISPLRLTVSQLAMPLLLVTALQIATLSTALVANPARAPMLLWLIGFAPLVTLLMLGIENAAFLLVPNNQQAVTPGDLTAIARNAILFLAKGAALVLIGGFAGGIGYGLYYITDVKSLGLAAAWMVTACFTIGTLPVIAHCFRTLDLSAAKPGTT